ncbi:MAG: hypothetical protein ACPG22_01845 [Prochlorococcaceae cyanobacterium]
MLDPSEQLRLRARLLEFLKFRVLASQEAFFEPWQRGDGCDAVRFRQWLGGLWPEALRLNDHDLLAVLDQARTLYVN